MQVLKGCLAAKNRFKSKMGKGKYSLNLSKMAAVTQEEMRESKKRKELQAADGKISNDGGKVLVPPTQRPD